MTTKKDLNLVSILPHHTHLNQNTCFVWRETQSLSVAKPEKRCLAVVASSHGDGHSEYREASPFLEGQSLNTAVASLSALCKYRPGRN